MTTSRHRLEQVETYSTTTEAIMRDPNFLRGVTEVRAGQPFDADCSSWNYERGRLFGACTTIPVFLDDGSLNSLAVAVFRTAYSRNLIL
jgi:hypothetical protein